MHAAAPLLTIPLLIGSAITFALTIYAWGRRHEPGVPAFMVTSFGLGAWSICYALELISAELESKLFWHRFVYTMVPLVPGPWMLFLYQYNKRSKDLPRWVVPALSVEPILFILLSWTNDYGHTLIWQSVTLDGPIPDLLLERGAFFWVHTVYSYVFILVATFFFIRMLRYEPSLPRWQVWLLGLAAISPMLVNVIHVLELNPFHPLDLTPFALATTGAASAWYAFRFELWDLLPAARNAIVTSMSDGVIVINLDHTIVDVNPAALQLLDRERSSVVGQSVEKVVPGWTADHTADVVAMQKNGRQSTMWEFELPHAQKDRYIDLMVSNLYDRANHYNGALLTLRNVTQRRLAEQALVRERTLLSQRVAEQTSDLRRANAELARVAQMKDEFLANMSHELRTPLNTVLGLSEALQEQVYGTLSERQLRALRNIEESGRHLLALINDILDVSKIEAGKLTLELRPVSVEDVCQSSLAFIRQMAVKKHIHVSYTPDPGATIFLADERRLKQMLVNLLSNAVKFTPEGGQIGLKVVGDRQHEIIRFVVSDTGIGIAPEEMKRLFQPFVQLDSRLSRQHEGSGLGLALVYRMADLHGGGVTAESTLGQGSHFTVALPWREPALDAYLRIGGDESLDLKALRRVLMIDSSATSVDQVRRYLLELGVELLVLTEGAGAIEFALLHQPDLIIMDLFLPDMTGWDLLAQLRAQPQTRSIPVLILSVMADALNHERLPDPTVQRVYQTLKPVTRSQLGKTLAEILRADDEQHPAATPALAAPQSTQNGHAAAPLVLVVEDNETNIRTLSDYLTAKAFQVDVARNGGEALQWVNTTRPDIVLLDIQMPGMDGLEVTRLMRANARLSSIPIIALTALAMPGDRERAIAAGVDDYVSKPVSLKGLVKLIEQHLQRAA